MDEVGVGRAVRRLYVDVLLLHVDGVRRARQQHREADAERQRAEIATRQIRAFEVFSKVFFVVILVAHSRECPPT